MSLAVEDVDQLHQYLCGVMQRADHHADEVKDIALALAGAIVWRKDPDEAIKVRTHGSETKNVLWVKISGQRYAFSYNHRDGTIEMRLDSVQGPTLHTFTNAVSLAEVREIFAAL